MSSWLGFAGDVIGAGLSYLGARETNEANSAIAQRQMDFQERMSSTQYRRGMVDMRKAGLNPMLAYQQGGASAPMGASIPAINTMEQASKHISQAAHSAAEIKALNAQTKKTLQDEKLAGQVTKNERMKEYMLKWETDIKRVLAEKTQYETQSAKSLANINKQAEALANLEGEINRSPLGEWTRKLNRITEAITGAARAGNSAKSLGK